MCAGVTDCRADLRDGCQQGSLCLAAGLTRRPSSREFSGDTDVRFSCVQLSADQRAQKIDVCHSPPFKASLSGPWQYRAWLLAGESRLYCPGEPWLSGPPPAKSLFAYARHSRSACWLIKGKGTAVTHDLGTGACFS